MPTDSFKAGFAALVGQPNVGKSTLLNALLGFKLSIVSPKPQTTKDAMLGILNEKNAQLIFQDTPGWLQPKDAFQDHMRQSILRSVRDDCDVVVWIVDAANVQREIKKFLPVIAKVKKPLVIVFNKIDLLPSPPNIEEQTKLLRPLIEAPFSLFLISAKNGSGIKALRSHLLASLPVSPPYYNKDQITDRWERYTVSELVREQLFKLTQQEIPHATAVRVDQFQEKKGRKDHIQLSLITETESQKKILIGRKGMAIRDLGTKARKAIEKHLGRPVFLELKVSVKKHWRKDPQFIRSLHEEIYK